MQQGSIKDLRFLCFICVAEFYWPWQAGKAVIAKSVEIFSEMGYGVTMKEAIGEHREAGRFRIRASCSSPGPFDPEIG